MIQKHHKEFVDDAIKYSNFKHTFKNSIDILVKTKNNGLINVNMYVKTVPNLSFGLNYMAYLNKNKEKNFIIVIDKDLKINGFTEDFGNSESFLYAQRLGQLRFILKAAIETIDALYIGDENEHTTPDEPEITFSELFEKWSEEKFSQVIRGKTLAKNTKKSYMNSYHTFLYLHERKFCSLTYDELQNHFDKSKNSFGTQHLEKTLLSAAGPCHGRQLFHSRFCRR